MPVAIKVKEYNGKKWIKTDHDLDFIFKKDGIEYGCEIKNTLGYIDKEELDIKIEMCSFFKVKPLLYVSQIYEISQKELVEKMEQVSGLPVVCSKSIPDGIIDRFEKWHIKTCEIGKQITG